MKTNPLLGTGYESFWLGPRLQWFWQHAGLGHINEAHNGYLEVYLNLGISRTLPSWLVPDRQLPDHLQKARSFQSRVAQFGRVDHSSSLQRHRGRLSEAV